jgi:sugar phosphate isomerase/epimerase
MTSIRYGSPTFLFRDICKNDLLGVLTNIAGCGFEGVELFGMFGVDPKSIRKRCDDIGLQVMCDHIPYNDFVSETDKIIEERALLGTPYITIDCFPEDKVPGAVNFSEAAEQIERIGSKCKKSGLTLLYHNQGFDLIDKVDGKTILEVLLDTIPHEYLSFQPDLGWIALGGGDPEYLLDKYRDRCPIIHLKDYYSSGPLLLRCASILGYKRGGKEYSDFEFRPTGYGIMNFAKLMPKVLACNPKWIVADHDLSYERDSLADLKASLEYVRKLVSLYI